MGSKFLNNMIGMKFNTKEGYIAEVIDGSNRKDSCTINIVGTDVIRVVYAVTLKRGTFNHLGTKQQVLLEYILFPSINISLSKSYPLT